MKTKTYNELVKRIEHLEKLLNGGPGSGNFGHLGRPGKVGGSSSSGHADYADEMRKYLEWEKRKKLRTKMKRMNIDKFDMAFEKELLNAGFSEDQIKTFRIAVITRQTMRDDKKAKQKELRARAKGSEEQTKAIDNVVDSISVSPKDETWLRNNCSPEMAQAFSDEVDAAKENGIDTKRVRLRLNDAYSTNGSMGYSEYNKTYSLTISKQILRDYEATKANREASGPNGSKWWTSDKLNGTFSHEFGHAMVHLFCEKRGILDKYNDSIANYIVMKAKENIVGGKYSERDKWTATQNNKATSLRMNKDKEWISQYGRTNSHEMIAESFANPDYSALTKEIVKIAKSDISLEEMLKTSGWKVTAAHLQGKE